VHPSALLVEPKIFSARTIPKLSIVMPCLNEAETLAICIGKAHNALAELAISGEVVIADNGSTDGSQEIARRAGARVIEVTERGYGCALRGGIAAAQGRWIIIGDADDSYDFGSIAPFVQKLDAGYELVMGCRMPWANGRIMKGAMPWKHRWIGNPGFTFLGRLFFKSSANDFYCGLRAFTKNAYERMRLSAEGMEFACEMVIQASVNKMSVGEVPITLHKDGRSGASHLRTWRDGWRTLRFMLLYCPKWLFFLPGAGLFTLGALFGGRLWAAPIKLGHVGFDASSLLVCSMCVLVGTQLVFLGAFARTYATIQNVLPPSQLLQRILGLLKLERSLIFALLILAVGLMLLANAILSWRTAHYGALSYPDSLRKIIPAVTLIMLGVQWLFFSFFLSVLQLQRRPSSGNG
jgi:hypothetical protein